MTANVLSYFMLGSEAFVFTWDSDYCIHNTQILATGRYLKDDSGFLMHFQETANYSP